MNRARGGGGTPEEERPDAPAANDDERRDAPAQPGAGTRPRRRFDAAYKLRIAEEADRATEPGQIGALLQREGLYWSHLASWRQQRDRGLLQPSGAAPGGPERQTVEDLARQVASLQEANRKLQERIAYMKALFDMQSQVLELMRRQMEPLLDEDDPE